MKEKIIALTKKEEFKTVAESLIAIQIAFLGLQVVVFVLAIMSKSSLWVGHIFAFIMVWLAFLAFKDFADDSKKKIGIWLCKLSLPLFITAILCSAINSGLSKMEGGNKGFFLFATMIAILAVLGCVMLYKNAKSQQFFENFHDKKTLDAIIGEQPEEIMPGDAVIGKKIDFTYKENAEKKYFETNLPARLPLKDRYLHMLILGPTGSGKTSQVIIPMIWRDIQNPDLGIIALEPKGDLAEKVYAMAKLQNREVQYFNPVHPDCPYFNPLFGLEEDVIENMATTFKMLDNDSGQFFQNMNENLIRNSIKVLKRLFENDATMLDLYTLVHNNEGKGKKIVQEFSQLQVKTKELQKENDDIVAWFLGDYFTGSTGDNRGATKTYEHCSGVRNQIAKLVSNKYLRKVLNPPKGHGSDVDFDDCLARGTVITIATAQGKLRDLGRFLGYFLILQLQSSVFRRPGNENTRRGAMLYIDEFQVYANPGFADMLTQGRSYRVASHLATQGRDQIGMGSGKDGEAFIQLVSSNARNIIFYPGSNFADAKYYSDYFGEEMVTTKMVGEGQQKMGIGNALQFRPINEQVRNTEAFAARFSPSDLIYRPFGEISYLFIKNNSISKAGIAKIEFIPREVNNTLDKMVEDYNELQEQRHEEEYEDAPRQNSTPSKPISGYSGGITPVQANSPQQSFKPVFDQPSALQTSDGLPGLGGFDLDDSESSGEEDDDTYVLETRNDMFEDSSNSTDEDDEEFL